MLVWILSSRKTSFYLVCLFEQTRIRALGWWGGIYVTMPAFHCLCFLENPTWSVFTVSDQINISENSRWFDSIESNNWFHLLHHCEHRPNLGAHTLSEFNKLSWKAHPCNIFLQTVVHSSCWPPFPCLHILCVASETRKRGAGEEPDGKRPQTLCLRHFLTGGTGLFTPLGFRALGKACSRSPQSNNMTKG